MGDASHNHDSHEDPDKAAEAVIDTPVWMPFLGIGLLLFGAVFAYSTWFSPTTPSAATIVQTDGGTAGSTVPSKQ